MLYALLLQSLVFPSLKFYKTKCLQPKISSCHHCFQGKKLEAMGIYIDTFVEKILIAI